MELEQNEPISVKDKICIHLNSEANALSISTTETGKFGVSPKITEKSIKGANIQPPFHKVPFVYGRLCFCIECYFGITVHGVAVRRQSIPHLTAQSGNSLLSATGVDRSQEQVKS